MSWSIGLHLGETVVEIAGRAEDSASPQTEQARYFSGQNGAEVAFNQFVAQHSVDSVKNVQIVSSLPLHIIDLAYGTPAAVLTTAGFENWLEMSLPLQNAHFTSKPARQPFLIDREFIFGVSERTNAQGHIEKLLDDSELEFLVSKLEMHKIKNVAVGFLHSQLNSENEKRARVFLEARGFKVFLSSAQKIEDEKARIWTAAFNAYVSPLFIERMTALSESIKKVLAPDGVVRLGPYRLDDVVAGTVTPLETAFSYGDFLSEKFARTAPLLYCGLEEFLFLSPHAEKISLWTHSAADFATTHLSCIKPDLQPLTTLGRSFFSEVAFSETEISFDPGPVVFGRGHTPTLFDLLISQDKDNTLIGLSTKITDKGRTRLHEALSAYARNLSEEVGVSAESLTKKLLQMAAYNWKSRLPITPDLTLCGPLAKIMQTLVGGQVIGNDFFSINALVLHAEQK